MCIVLCYGFAFKIDWLDEIWIFILMVMLLLYFVEKDDSKLDFPNAISQSICCLPKQSYLHNACVFSNFRWFR